jgi:hypothetical protein
VTNPIRIVLPMVTPSLNETQRMHWAKRRKLARAWAWDFTVWMRVLDHATWIAAGRRRVAIERVGAKLLDKDNLVGGVKIPVDAMNRLGIIRDDSPEWLELEVTQRKAAKGEKPHTEITITDHPSFSCMFPDRAK